MAWNLLNQSTDRTTSTGLTYQWKFTARRKNTPPSAELSIDMQTDYHLSFEQENWGRRIAKALGFATEFQTGEMEFDKTVYISCDDMMLCNRLHVDSEMRRIILSFFRFGVSLITLRKGKLRLKLSKVSTSFSVGNTGEHATGLSYLMEVPATLHEEVADALVTALNRLKTKLTLMPTGMEGEVSQSKIYQRRALICQWLIGGVSIGGVVAFFWDRIASYKLTYYDLYYQLALPSAAAATTACIVLIYGLFHHSSLGYAVLRNFLIFGVTGLYLCSSEIAYHINVRMDNSPREEHVSRLLEKHISRGRKGGKTYHLQLQDWNHPGQPYKMTTNQSFYDSVTVGQPISIYTHPGKLGYEWIEGYQ